MRHALFMLLIAFMLLLPAASWSADVSLILDPFDYYSLGKTFTDNTVNSNTSPPTWGAINFLADARTATVVPDPAGGSSQVLDIYDSNADTKDHWIYHYLKQVGSYTFTDQFDVRFDQNTAGFIAKVNLANTSNLPNNGRSWVAAIAFEGNQAPWAGGVGSNPGRISYETKSFTQVWEATSATYTPNTWYTVVIFCDLINKIYTVKFGPKGGDLPEITPAGGVPFIYKQDVTPNTQLGQVNCISFATSPKTGGDPAETAGHMYIDNVYVHGASENAGEWIHSVDDIRKLPIGTYVETYPIQGRCAMVGTDQLGKPFFYLTDNTPDGKKNPRGIRVRQDPLMVTVHQGDTIDLSGYVQRASDNGAKTTTTGEKEILAIALAAYPQGSAIPTPRSMNNRDIGGGDQIYPKTDGTSIEGDGKPTYPGVFGGWIDATAVPPTWKKAPGPNNAGTYGRFYGKVTYVAQDSTQPYWPYIYIDDGSGVFDGSLPDGTNQQKGVRVLLRKDRTDMVDFTKLLGKNVIVPGVIGAVSTSDLLPSQPVYNCRVIRAIEEAFYDDNGNGYYDGPFSNDWNYDSNLNGIYDGILVLN